MLQLSSISCSHLFVENVKSHTPPHKKTPGREQNGEATPMHGIHFTFAQLTHHLMLLSCFGAWPLRNPTLQLTHLHLHRQRDILCHLLHMGGARIITAAGQEKSQAIFLIKLPI